MEAEASPATAAVADGGRGAGGAGGAGGARKKVGSDKTAEQDAARVARAACLQGERERTLMKASDGTTCIKLLGGGQFSCLTCDDPLLLAPTAAHPKPRSLGEGCSTLAAHLISVKGTNGHGPGHIALHGRSLGREPSQEEIQGIRANGSSKSYSDKRNADSARGTAARINKIAKLAA